MIHTYDANIILKGQCIVYKAVKTIIRLRKILPKCLCHCVRVRKEMATLEQIVILMALTKNSLLSEQVYVNYRQG